MNISSGDLHVFIFISCSYTFSHPSTEGIKSTFVTAGACLSGLHLYPATWSYLDSSVFLLKRIRSLAALFPFRLWILTGILEGKLTSRGQCNRLRYRVCCFHRVTVKVGHQGGINACWLVFKFTQHMYSLSPSITYSFSFSLTLSLSLHWTTQHCDRCPQLGRNMKTMYTQADKVCTKGTLLRPNVFCMQICAPSCTIRLKKIVG